MLRDLSSQQRAAPAPTCASCNGALSPGRLLFCLEVCSEFAKNIRNHRRALADGRIRRPDVRAAVSVRMAYALWG
jgi:hypothetical protein